MQRTPTFGTTDNAVERAARRYLERGWSVVPIAAGSKRPLVGWRVFQTRQPDAAELLGWFRRWPTANLAIVTGAVSGLVVLDVDPRHGGNEALDALQHELGRLPPTLSAVSGGGGRHLYFRHPGYPVPNSCGWRPGIDVRGDGGYIVAPPSMHASGERYRWIPAPADSGVAPLPASLTRSPGTRTTRTTGQWRDLLRVGVGPGARNNSIAALAGHLLQRGVDPGVTMELLLSWNRARCRPPLADDEVAQTLVSIQRTRLRRAQVPVVARQGDASEHPSSPDRDLSMWFSPSSSTPG